MVEQSIEKPTGQGSVAGALGGQESLSPHNYLLKYLLKKVYQREGGEVDAMPKMRAIE